MTLSTLLELVAGGCKCPSPPGRKGPCTCGHGAAVGALKEAYQFYSPNVDENLNFKTALTRLKSADQKRFALISKDVDAQIGLDATPHDAVGDWSDGAENSIFNVIRGKATWEQVRYSAAVKGLIANQKAVIPFVRDPKGADTVYRFTVKDTLDGVRSKMDKAGLGFRTLIPRGDNVDVVVFDPGSSLKSSIQSLGSTYANLKVKTARGRGEFLGGDNRTQGRAAYGTAIREYERRNVRGRYRGLDRVAVGGGFKVQKVAASITAGGGPCPTPPGRQGPCPEGGAKDTPLFESKAYEEDGLTYFTVTLTHASAKSSVGPYANKAGVVGGLSSFVDEDTDSLVIDDTWLEPNLQGKGYGKRMYRDALAYAQKRGLSGMRSYDRPSTMARRVWKSIGGTEHGGFWRIDLDADVKAGGGPCATPPGRQGPCAEGGAQRMTAAQRENYLHGECCAFAWALHEETGWPLRGVYLTVNHDDGSKGDLIHSLVQIPGSGKLVDASGVTSIPRIARTYGLKVGDFEVVSTAKTRGEIASGIFKDADVSEARPFARGVLAATGLVQKVAASIVAGGGPCPTPPGRKGPCATGVTSKLHVSHKDSMGKSYTVAVSIDGKTLGSITLTVGVDEPKSGYVHNAELLKEHQGKKLAGNLYSELIRHARTLGLTHLYSDNIQKPAIRHLWQKLGAVLVDKWNSKRYELTLEAAEWVSPFSRASIKAGGVACPTPPGRQGPCAETDLGGIDPANAERLVATLKPSSKGAATVRIPFEYAEVDDAPDVFDRGAARYMNVPVAQLIGTQPDVVPSTVLYFLKGGKRPSDEPLAVTKDRGRFYVMDGHHYVAALRLAGVKVVRALVDGAGVAASEWVSPLSPVGADYLEIDIGMQMPPTQHPPSLRNPIKVKLPTAQDGFQKGATKMQRRTARQNLAYRTRLAQQNVGGTPTTATTATTALYPSMRTVF